MSKTRQDSKTSILDTPLPPIDAVPMPLAARKERADQAEIDAEMNAMHEALGVKRGAALEEALKPKLEVPSPFEKTPFEMAAAAPRAPTSGSTATTAGSATAPNDTQAGAAPADISDGVAAEGAAPPQQLLALPAPEDVNSLITLDVSTGQAVTLDHLGPVVVNTDGTLARITNWTQLSEQERNVTKRRIAKRNIERLTAFKERGELKDDLVSALRSSSM